MADRLPSLDLIADEVREERVRLTDHADALDQKASTVLGFSAAVAALLTRDHSLLALSGTMAAVTASFPALRAYQPRTAPLLGFHELRDRYLNADSRFTRLRLTDTYIEICLTERKILERKASLVGWSMHLLFAAVMVLLIVGIVNA